MPASARPRRRRVLATAGIIAASMLLYGTVVALYAADERSRLTGECDPSAGEIVVDIAPESVDALRDRLAITVTVGETGSLVLSPLGYADPVTVVVNGTAGDRAFTTPADSIPGTFATSLIADGSIEQWPFDVHTATAQFVVVQTGDGEPAAYLPDVCAGGQVSGWALSAAEGDGSEDFTVDGHVVPAVILTATRSPATVAFALVILILLTALPVLGLTVAIAAFRGRRKVEATLMSWMGAMLFAVVPLRGFLPGSPPVGSWVDYLVVLWVVGGLVAALVVYVAAWLKWTPAASGPPPAR